MDYPRPPDLPSFQPSADRPDGLLAELRAAHIALGIAEDHIRLWRASSTMTGNIFFRSRLPHIAHEALDEAGEAIERTAELLRIQANGTLDHAAQIDYTEPIGHHPR